MPRISQAALVDEFTGVHFFHLRNEGLILRNGQENQFYLPPVEKEKEDREDGRITPGSSDDDSLDYPIRNLDAQSYR